MRRKKKKYFLFHLLIFFFATNIQRVGSLNEKFLPIHFPSSAASPLIVALYTTIIPSDRRIALITRLDFLIRLFFSFILILFLLLFKKGEKSLLTSSSFFFFAERKFLLFRCRFIRSTSLLSLLHSSHLFLDLSPHQCNNISLFLNFYFKIPEFLHLY